MPGGLSVKLILVLAAFAFVGAFRIHASADDGPANASTLSSAGASALASDTATAPVAVLRGVAAPELSRVAALPALHRAPARPKKKVVKAPAKTTGRTATPPPAATVVPRAPVVPRTPARAPSTPRSYVGKSFDSKG